MPTFLPGWMRVPSWRTRMLPALANSPPYTFTPRRWPALSRPFRVLPCPFLCAMAARSHIDAGHAHRSLVLAVSLAAAIVLAPLLLEYEDLLGAALLDQHGVHARAGDRRRADLHGAVQRGHQHLGELQLGAGLAVELFELEDVAGRYPVLLSSGFDYSVVHGLLRA